jgi:hypothetical protein
VRARFNESVFDKYVISSTLCANTRNDWRDFNIGIILAARVARWHMFFKTKNPDLGKFWRVFQ